MKILEAKDGKYLIEHEGFEFIAERTGIGVVVSGSFDKLAAETNTHPEDLFDLVMETIFG